MAKIDVTTMLGKEQFETVNDGLLVRAPAKVNLSLLIAGKRPDGFHEIETVMAKVNFYDEVLIQPGRKAGIELNCKGPHWAPQGEENLVHQACEMLLNSCRSKDVIPAKAGIKITLTKNIPAGTGLGSASSDAAATLIGVNRYLKLGVSQQQLGEMAAALGSDVAFFLDGRLAFCTGKGEKVKKLDQNFDFLALLVLPDITVSTKRIYDNYKHNTALYKKLSRRINVLVEKNNIDLASKMCANMLQETCFELYKELADLKNKIESAGFVSVCLSGSGSAFVCIFDTVDEKKARENKRKLEEITGCKCILVSSNRW